MRDDGDFAAYAEARWPTLVRTLVLLGSPVHEAVGVAERTLVRCLLEWREIGAAGDIDVEVYAEMLDERARTLAEGSPGAPVEPDPARDPSDAALLLEALGEQLDRLGPADRCAVVLRHGAGLSMLQVAEALDVEQVEVEERLAGVLAVLDAESLVQRCP